MKYYIIAGEPSGDLHGSNLMKGIVKADPEAEFRFWGGDMMAEVGGKDNLEALPRDVVLWLRAGGTQYSHHPLADEGLLSWHQGLRPRCGDFD